MKKELGSFFCVMFHYLTFWKTGYLNVLLKHIGFCCLKFKCFVFSMLSLSENVSNIDEYLCNGEHFVTCPSVTSVLRPCHLPSFLHLVHAALLWKWQLLFPLYCLILWIYFSWVFESFLTLKNCFLVLWNNLDGVSMSGVCVTFLQKIGCLTISMSYLFNSSKTK